MDRLTFVDGVYESPPPKPSLSARMFPALCFYRRFLAIVLKSSQLAKRGMYDGETWSRYSLRVLRALEAVGARVRIEGMDHLTQLDKPCVFIANHMSVLETVVLPAIVQPFRPHTYVVKQGLLEYPVFKHIMRTRDPIAVTRTHPRADMRAVMEDGVERLVRGTSIVVFPQTTRTAAFDSERFNTIGIKLARKANAPAVPLALKTDAWANGKLLKDFGKIDPSKPVHFAFGEPIRVRGRGADEHQAIIDFIEEHLREWGMA